VAGAVKAAAGAVAEKVEERRAAKEPAGSAGVAATGGDVKNPQTRTAQRRNPTMGTPDKTGESQATSPAPSNPAEAAGVAQNQPAGDGKPAADTDRGAGMVDGKEEKK
jgi:NADH-quinone oxidoreductase subunit E